MTLFNTKYINRNKSHHIHINPDKNSVPFILQGWSFPDSLLYHSNPNPNPIQMALSTVEPWGGPQYLNKQRRVYFRYWMKKAAFPIPRAYVALFVFMFKHPMFRFGGSCSLTVPSTGYKKKKRIHIFSQMWRPEHKYHFFYESPMNHSSPMPMLNMDNTSEREH